MSSLKRVETGIIAVLFVMFLAFGGLVGCASSGSSEPSEPVDQSYYDKCIEYCVLTPEECEAHCTGVYK